MLKRILYYTGTCARPFGFNTVDLAVSKRPCKSELPFKNQSAFKFTCFGRAEMCAYVCFPSEFEFQ